MLLENYNCEAPGLQNQGNSLNKSDANDLSPEGPAFNSHAREGADRELLKLSAEGVCELVLTLTPSSPSLSMTTRQSRTKSTYVALIFGWFFGHVCQW